MCLRKSYPAIYGHFQPFKDGLIRRQDQGRFYWELHRATTWMSSTDRRSPIRTWPGSPSLLVKIRGASRITPFTSFPPRDSALLAILNSPVLWWYMWRTAQHGKDEA